MPCPPISDRITGPQALLSPWVFKIPLDKGEILPPVYLGLLTILLSNTEAHKLSVKG